MERNYTYYDFTLSLCSTCLRRVDAKIIFQDEKVYMLKRCPEHGSEKVLLATDIPYYKNIRNYNKPSEMPLKFSTKTHYGCPYDCGLCHDHEQHSCLTVVERFNLLRFSKAFLRISVKSLPRICTKASGLKESNCRKGY